MRFLLSHNTESSLQKADEILSKTKSDSPELLVLLAETAVKLKKFETAKRALKTYFGSERSKNRNQFYVRALFATACIESNRSNHLRNRKKIEGLKHACSYVHRGMEIISRIR